jgi:uncharacterized protein YjiS (DUF1127 family)
MRKMERHMTIFPLVISRFTGLAALWFVRWQRTFTTAQLEALSDRGLQDIGLEPNRREFDAVKPFWMP